MGEIDRPPEVYEEMTEEERQSLLAALKAKWDAVNANYQKITHLVLLDTTGQVRRKERFENELSQIEKDIDKLERASSVLIKPY
jgi:signal recognition particle GTPase